MTTWEEIRDEIAGMLADGKPLEDVITKLEQRKNEMAMKCPKCGGNAEVSNWGSYTDPDFADFHVECEKCGYHSMGSTDLQKAKEMFANGMGMYYTNEQWLHHMNTEQLTEWVKGHMNCNFCPMRLKCEDMRDCMEHIKVWLKQPHR